ncbi:EAL domain-containing protein [Cohnella sp. JJ-181]|uniref:EAL domain-containing protein n=1 Tax=Cohnella rhizoplanae TaxID=2974897 RepID=UPI0022FF8166|nr:EAL domain-containing protein [Cohnella sp. JJ-181]CAI6079890.1 Sensor histidine kinase RcsC [Cohnella sp. JJ-181]
MTDPFVNILLVDDRPENLLALEAIVEQKDYRIVKATSGEEALAHLLRYDFATILLDVQMPGIDGFATAKIIKARERTKNIPILFITANNMDAEHIFKGYALGAVDYILKPIDPFILKAKVAGFVDLYKMSLRLAEQAEALLEKARELEKANAELTAMTEDLRESEALAGVINETSIDSMIVMDELGVVLKVNPAVRSMFQWTEEDMRGRNVRMLFAEGEARDYVGGMLESAGGIGYHNLREATAVRRDGTAFPAEVQIGRRYVANKAIVACTIRDITAKKEAQELITHMAYHDGLTDLPNRRLFNDRLHEQLNRCKRHNKPLALLYLDLDLFKNINDSLGHHTGDRLLQEVAKRLVGSVRDGDVVARVGGDEFILLLPETNRETAIEVAETIMERCKAPYAIDHYELYFTASIGMSVFPFDGEDAPVLMKNADAALYRAKEQGKNKLKVFHSGMNIQSYRAFVLQHDLRKSIERSELSLFYQPRVDVDTGTVTSVEALLRWRHPSWGMILPSEFIPLAEESGQIVEIENWVLRTACLQCKQWNASGLMPVRIAINFSAQQFWQKDLPDKIKSAIAEAGIRPSELEIEITESTLLRHEEGITAVLEQIRKMGVKISIDDFGVGYSSLNYLRKYPLDTLKIDKSFIQDISSKSPGSIALVSSILTLAESLNMSVIAEGVETEEQLDVLKKERCRVIQGYLFCPPVPPEELEALLPRKEAGDSREASEKTPPVRPGLHSRPESVPLTETGRTDQNQAILQVAIFRTKEQYDISSRETEVFQLIVEGLSNKEISEKLFISEHTVKNHITRIFQKLNVTDRMQAMSFVYQACMEESQKRLAQ